MAKKARQNLTRRINAEKDPKKRVRLADALSRSVTTASRRLEDRDIERQVKADGLGLKPHA
jgi:hypothetical protein